MIETEDYPGLTKAAKLAEVSGNLGEARDLFARARRVAQSNGDSVKADRAYCGSAANDIALDRVEPHLSELRRILADSDASRRFSVEPGEVAFLAAYNLSCAYYRLKQNRKGLFYLRVARRRAEELDREDWIAWCSNQGANLLLADGEPTEAAEGYRSALERLGAEGTVQKAKCLANLGYCRVLEGALNEGLRLLYEGLRLVRRFSADHAGLFVRLGLAQALLDRDKPQLAYRHAIRALRYCDDHGEREELVNALFLAGDAAIAMGHEEEARRHFERLQCLYPKLPCLSDLLLTVQLRDLVNLRA